MHKRGCSQQAQQQAQQAQQLQAQQRQHLSHTARSLNSAAFTWLCSRTAQTPCSLTSPAAATCLDGFSIQGNFESARRNYTRLWAQMAAARAAGSIPTSPPVKPFHLHLVGRGDVKTLGIPPSVANMTTVHFNLRFPEYYEQVGVMSAAAPDRMQGCRPRSPRLPACCDAPMLASAAAHAACAPGCCAPAASPPRLATAPHHRGRRSTTRTGC